MPTHIFNDVRALKVAATNDQYREYHHFYERLLDNSEYSKRLLRLINSGFFGGNESNPNDIWPNIEALIKDQYPHPPDSPLKHLRLTKLQAILRNESRIDLLCHTQNQDILYRQIYSQIKCPALSELQRLEQALNKEVKGEEKVLKSTNRQLLESLTDASFLERLQTKVQSRIIGPLWTIEELTKLVHHASRFHRYAPDILQQSQAWSDSEQKKFCFNFMALEDETAEVKDEAKELSNDETAEVEDEAQELRNNALASYAKIANEYNQSNCAWNSEHVWRLLIKTILPTYVNSVIRGETDRTPRGMPLDQREGVLRAKIQSYLHPMIQESKTETSLKRAPQESPLEMKGAAEVLPCEAGSCLKKFGVFVAAEVIAAGIGYLSLSDAKALAGLAEALNWSVATVGAVTLALVVAFVFAGYLAYTQDINCRQKTMEPEGDTFQVVGSVT